MARLRSLASDEPTLADDPRLTPPDIDTLIASAATGPLGFDHPGSADEGSEDGRATQSAPDRAQAARLYAEGRLRRRTDDALAAARVLTEAARLDPSSPALRTELAEARLAAGLRRSAMQTFGEAIALGEDRARPLLLVGLERVRAGEYERGGALLGRALRAPDRRSDAVLEPVAQAALGEALLSSPDRARQAGGAMMLLAALDLPERLSAPTRYTTELTDVFRRRSALATRAGEVLERGGQAAAANAAFELAVRTAGVDQRSAVIRHAAFLRDAGRPANAALLLLDALETSAGRVDGGTVRALAELGAFEGVRAPLADALRSMGDRLRGDASPTVLAGLARASATVLGGRAGDEPRLRALGTLERSEGVLIDLASRSGTSDASERVPLAMRAARARPDMLDALADALIVVGVDGPALAGELAGSDDQLGVALASLVHVRLGLLGDPPMPGWDRLDGLERASAANAAARAAIASGRFNDATRALEAVRRTASELPDGPAAARARLLLGRTLLAMRRGGEAIEALRAGVGNGRAADLLELAGALQRAGDTDGVADTIARATAADPDDERVAERALGLHTQGGAAPDEVRAGAALRTLRERASSSRTVRVLAARELIGSGAADEADRRLRALFTERPGDASLLALLEQAWQRARGDRATADRVEWAARVVRAHPATPAAHLVHASALNAAGRIEDAAGALLGAIDRVPSTALMRAREGLLRSVLGRGDDARAASIARLEAGSRGVGSVIEYAEALVGDGRDDEAAQAASTELPRADVFALTESEIARLSTLVESLLLNATGDAERAPSAIRLADASERAGAPLTPSASRSRLLLALRDGSAAEITELFERGETPEAVRIEAVRRLAQAERFDTAAGVAMFELRRRERPENGASAGEIRNSEYAAWSLEIARTIALRASEEAALDTINELQSNALLEDFARALLAQFGLDERAEGPLPSPRAETAYVIASLASSFEADVFSERMLEAALIALPDHPWAANDLGYRLAESGRDLLRAERLVEAALAQRPESASVWDSLGWVRYKLGVLDDAPAEPQTGGEVRLGAVSLLRRASTMPGGSDNETIYEQLGDALWAAGDRAGAVESWQEAERLATRQLRPLRTSGRIDSQRGRQLSALVLRTRGKQTAAAAGLEPQIAPMGDDVEAMIGEPGSTR